MQRTENKNEDDREKEKDIDIEKEKLIEKESIHSQNYDVEDDLENFLVKGVHQDSDDLSHPLLKKKDKEEDHFIKSTHNKFYNFKNILNIISLCFLLFTCLSPIIYYLLISKDISGFYDFFKTNSIHLQIKFEIFLACWILIIIAIFVSILRHSIYFNSNINEFFFLTKIISYRLNHNYYLANFLLVLNLVILYLDKSFSQTYGIFVTLSFFSSLFYFLVFRELKKEKFIFKKFLNYIAFNISISFVLAWANYLLVTSLCIFFEIGNVITQNNSELIGYTIQGIICLISVLIIVYYRDPFYVIFLLMYQIGLSWAADDKKTSYENNLNLVFTLFTAVCLIFGVFLLKKGNEEEEKENVLKNYKNEGKQYEML